MKSKPKIINHPGTEVPALVEKKWAVKKVGSIAIVHRAVAAGWLRHHAATSRTRTYYTRDSMISTLTRIISGQVPPILPSEAASRERAKSLINNRRAA